MKRALFNVMRVLGTIGVAFTGVHAFPIVWETYPVDAFVVATALFTLVVTWWSAP